MSEEPLTLSMLAGLETDHKGLPITAEEREKALSKLREAAAFDGFSAFNIGERLLDFLGESLRKPVAGVMAEVWSQRKDLKAMADKTKARKDLETSIELYDHTISFGVHPSVAVHVDGAELGKMIFDCKANLRIQGVQLVVRNAWITKMKAGKLTSTVAVEYKGIPIMPPCKKTVDLAVSMNLPRGGIRLGGEERPVAGEQSL